MTTKSQVINGHRFQIDNGVRHPKFGDGVVSCAWGETQWWVQFDHGKEVVDDVDLESLPSKGLYRKSNRQLSMERGQIMAARNKAQTKIKEAKRREKLKKNQGKTRSLV